MTDKMEKMPGTQGNEVAGRDLGDLLLELAGKSSGRMLTAKRHVGILEEALPLLDKGQQIVARRRIRSLEQRWGILGNNGVSPPGAAGTDGIPVPISPELRTARWLSKRRNWSRYIRILHRAAVYFQHGGTCLSDAQSHAYALELDSVIPDVGLSSFTEWMMELRIAERSAARTYRSGELCEWWVNEMAPTKSEQGSYGLCISLATELCRRKLPHRR